MFWVHTPVLCHLPVLTEATDRLIDANCWSTLTGVAKLLPVLWGIILVLVFCCFRAPM